MAPGEIVPLRTRSRMYSEPGIREPYVVVDCKYMATLMVARSVTNHSGLIHFTSDPILDSLSPI